MDIKYKQMLYIGYKYKVIVICASISSLLWVLISVINVFEVDIVSFLAGIDFTINIFCLMLMTNYYPDERYYQRLCYLCICCCDWNKRSLMDKSMDISQDDNNKNDHENSLNEMVKTTETMDQKEVEVIAGQQDYLLTNPQQHDTHDNNNNDMIDEQTGAIDMDEK